MMYDFIFYKENQIDIEDKIPYYKKLGVNAIIINPLYNIDEDILEDIFRMARIFEDQGIFLFIEIDIIEVSKMLLEKDTIDWKMPKIRSGFYKFISYLSKYGIRGIYYKNLQKLWDYSNGSYQQFDNFIRELGKNTRQNKKTLAIASISTEDKKLEKIILDSGFYNFDGVEIEARVYDDLIDFKKSIADKDSNIESNKLSDSTKSLINLTNFKNFPYQSQTLAAGLKFFLKSYPVLKKNEEFGGSIPHQNSNDYNLLKESEQILEYYKSLIEIRKSNPAFSSGTIRQIFNNDKDILAFVRTYKDEKTLVFANFSQKEVLCDIRFHFLDLYDFKYLIGNYGKRRIVKNLLLRPYEFVSFVK